MATLKNTIINDTGFLQLPSGTTAQRPGSPVNGDIRYNSTFNVVEQYVSNSWKYMPPIVENGLVLNLDAAEPASYPGSGTTWTDLSGNGRNATVNGTVSFVDNYFNISSDSTYISLSNSGLIPRTNDFTYSCWIYFNSVDSLDTIFENGSWTDTLLFRYETNLFTVYAEGDIRGIFSWTANIGSWVNIVLRRETGIVSCFINNVSIGVPFSMTTDIDLANPNLWLMRSQYSTGQWTNGRISVFKIYNRALTLREIQQNFNALRGRYGI
jgi:hypothetical protein